eukprot:scaffold345_cov134-Cylindrotheca_fusiformis.AAC.76
MRIEGSNPGHLNGVVGPSSVSPTTNETQHTEPNEPPSKRPKLETKSCMHRGSDPLSSSGAQLTNPSPSFPPSHDRDTTRLLGVPAAKDSRASSSVVTNSPVVSNTSGSSSVESMNQNANVSKTPNLPTPPPCAPYQPPQNLASGQETNTESEKSTTMGQLGTKYLGELQYMLIEFRKLERQLLGNKGAAPIEESAGSRARREKLHSFIIHLEDTIRQIEEGCRLEAERNSTVEAADRESPEIAKESSRESIEREKEAEESVQKLEEHILENLLPVKVRLKKQLANQKGATRNPVGMPAPRRGSFATAPVGKGTFAAAAEQRRKQAEAARLAAEEQQEQKLRHVSDPTQFGTPLKGGSSLTRNLHGTTLGSKQRTHGHGVGAPAKDEEENRSKQILYAGMVPESTQHRSGVAAATGVHDMVIENPSLIPESCPQDEQISDRITRSPAQSSTTAKQDTTATDSTSSAEAARTSKLDPFPTTEASAALPSSSFHPKLEMEVRDDTEKSEEDRRKHKKMKRKRKLVRISKRRERERQRQLALNQQAQATHMALKVPGGERKKAILGKGQGRKKGPRAVEYICAQCNDPYNSTCDYNPWWALAQQECPKCRKVQIPRIDITAPANSIEYHPALLAHAEDHGGSGGANANMGVEYLPKAPPPMPPVHHSKPAPNTFRDITAFGSDSDSELSELSDGSLSYCSSDSYESDLDLQSLTPAEQAEHETFGHEYTGPKLSDNHSSRLLVLMQHASTCPCRHKSARHRDVCRSTKYMMLHVRDCPGTTSTFDICPFPWCRKVKHLLYHLVACPDGRKCSICFPKDLSKSLQALVGLNNFRAKRYREHLITSTKKANAARQASLSNSHKGNSSELQPPFHPRKSGGLPNAPKPGNVSYVKNPPKVSQPLGSIRKPVKAKPLSSSRTTVAPTIQPTPSAPVCQPLHSVPQTKEPQSQLATPAYHLSPAPGQVAASKRATTTTEKKLQPGLNTPSIMPSPTRALMTDLVSEQAGQSISDRAEGSSELHHCYSASQTATIPARDRTASESVPPVDPAPRMPSPQSISSMADTAVVKTEQSKSTLPGEQPERLTGESTPYVNQATAKSEDSRIAKPHSSEEGKTEHAVCATDMQPAAVPTAVATSENPSIATPQLAVGGMQQHNDTTTSNADSKVRRPSSIDTPAQSVVAAEASQPLTTRQLDDEKSVVRSPTIASASHASATSASQPSPASNYSSVEDKIELPLSHQPAAATSTFAIERTTSRTEFSSSKPLKLETPANSPEPKESSEAEPGLEPEMKTTTALALGKQQLPRIKTSSSISAQEDATPQTKSLAAPTIQAQINLTEQASGSHQGQSAKATSRVEDHDSVRQRMPTGNVENTPDIVKVSG